MFCPLCGHELVLTGAFAPLPDDTVKSIGGYLAFSQTFAVQCPGCAGSVLAEHLLAEDGVLIDVVLSARLDGGAAAARVPPPSPLRFVLPR